MSLTEFWKKQLTTLKNHIKNHPNDACAKNALQECYSNTYLKRYLSGE